jgi:hypothetical protein
VLTLCADIDGLSLHAAVRCGADDRHALEQLCRYITTHLVMSPLEFMQRLTALVPRPVLPVIRFHRVLAPVDGCFPFWGPFR